MGSQSAMFNGVRIRKIENGYVLSWEEEKDVGGDLGYTVYVEYYAPSLPNLVQRLTTLFHGK